MANKRPTTTHPELPARAPANNIEPSERQFMEALERIYRRYGGDLSAFRRDVEAALAKREDPSHAA